MSESNFRIGNHLEVETFGGGIGPKFEYAERAKTVLGKLEHFALKSKSISMRDVIARSATNLQYDANDVLRILRTMRSGRLPGVGLVKRWDKNALLALARIFANQRQSFDDIEDAEVLFNAVRAVHGLDNFGKNDPYIYAEVLTSLQRHSAAVNIFKQSKAAKKDPNHLLLLSANAKAMSANDSWENWAETVNQVYLKRGFVPIKVSHDENLAPFDRICAAEPVKKVDGPLVSVIVPTYNRGPLLNTAIRALKDQSWQNLEIILVDDGSDEPAKKFIREVLAKNPDLKVVWQTENLGAYVARNDALSLCRGKYITVHDDDDWSHPQKIQTQVENLESHPELYGNMSSHVRITNNLEISRINNNPTFIQSYFGSLMYRREVFDLFGPFDPANRSADAEFRDRVVAATGVQIPVISPDVPLSFIRLHLDSLTSGEINRGYMDPARIFYQDSYKAAFRNKKEDTAWKDLEFVHPSNMIAGNRNRDHGHFDVVFATDFAFPGGTSTITLKEISAATNMGLRVGVLQLSSPLNCGRPEIQDGAFEVWNKLGVEIVNLKDQLTTKLLLVRHPSVLQFADNLMSRIEPEKIVVIINNPPVLTGGKGYTFDMQDVRKNAKKTFGIDPVFVAESGVTRSLSIPLARRSELSENIWPGFIEEIASTPRVADPQRKPRVGRHSRDNVFKWPSYLHDFRHAYVSNDVYEVSALGGISSLSPAAQDLLHQNAKIFPFNGVSVPDYLSEIDFWVYFHSEKLTESFGMSVIEAMAQGLVVILPEYMKANFGEGAIYCKPSETREIVSNLWSNPELYREQSEKAIEVSSVLYSTDSFIKRLNEARIS